MRLLCLSLLSIPYTLTTWHVTLTATIFKSGVYIFNSNRTEPQEQSGASEDLEQILRVSTKRRKENVSQF